MNYRAKVRAVFFTLFVTAVMLAGCSSGSMAPKSSGGSYSWLNLDTVKAGKFDTGRMWTFEYAPKDYFQSEYNFAVTEKWLDDVRMSALRFANYCSASFVSADGLVMTNDHCARESVTQVNREGEDLMENGFFAATLEEERQVPGLFVDQLVLIKDVTEEIQTAIDKGTTAEEKSDLEKQTIKEIEKKETDATGYKVSITKLFNGGKYSLYGYKTYNDVRLVFSPETQLGFFGGDPDNFTYPRYNLDCSFFRVYDEDGKPLKTNNYFKWSASGAEPGEAVFVVGNPGSTSRLVSVAQLEFMRDVTHPRVMDLLDGLVAIYSKLLAQHPERKAELQNRLFSYANSQKAYGGILKGLREPILMAKKKDFERTFKKAIDDNPRLAEKYNSLWGEIALTLQKQKEISNELYFYSINPFRSSQYFIMAGKLVSLAEQKQLPEDQRKEAYKGDQLQNTIDGIFPENFDEEYQRMFLEMQVGMMIKYLGMENSAVQKLTGGRTNTDDAVSYILNNSLLTSKEKVQNLAVQDAEAILNSPDPVIQFTLIANEKRPALSDQQKTLSAKEGGYTQLLGRALFEVYGTSIPPDATFTLRISDGVVEGFPYNGTVAPPITTFYGMYDRYYGFNKEYPWNLPEKWIAPPAEFELSTPFNFVSTNDIIGGNSGSPVINKKAEIVGLAFDGNIQSLPGSFIFTTEENRTVSVHSQGMYEALKDLYKATRLSDELKNGTLSDDLKANKKED